METNPIVAPTQTVVQPAAISPEVAEMMAISLNGGIPPEPAPDAAPDTTDSPSPDASTSAPSTSPDIFQPFKEKFGYASAEDAMREIEELRAYKASPPEIQIENEESARLLRAFAKGKEGEDEVYSYLDQKRKLENYLSRDITAEIAPDIIKLGMQLQHRDLTQAEIDYKYNKQFAIPPKPLQRSEEEAEVYAQRLSDWESMAADRKMELMIEAKLAKPALEAAKSKLVLPEIDTQVDPGYLQYKKMLEEEAALAPKVKEAYKVFTPESIETKINFKDEANKIDMEFQYKPDPESFARTMAVTDDLELFWKYFDNPDGTPNRQKFLHAVHLIMNEEKMFTEAMKQAKNAAIKANLPDNSQPGGLVRQLHQSEEPTELDQYMQRALSGYMKK